jgi:hypothetical protein
LREIERVVNDRHGTVPDTDDADVYLIPVAQCFRKILVDKGKPASVDAVMQRFGFWCERWAPGLSTDQVADIVRGVLAQPKLDADDDLGATLRLSYADRQRLGIRTIGSYDVDRKSRTKLARARKQERDRLHAEEIRRAKGAIPRAVYEARGLSKMKPWEKMGISRATYYRRGANAHAEIETSPSPHSSFYQQATDLSRLAQGQPQGPAPCLPPYHSARTVNPFGVSLRSPFG